MLLVYHVAGAFRGAVDGGPAPSDDERVFEAVPSMKLAPVALLLLSNVFMTTAWYWHLKYKEAPLGLVIAVSWAIALVEYCLAVPANRLGHGTYSAAELKTMQEVITLVVFAVFSVVYLGERIGPSHVVGFALIGAGAFFVFRSPLG